MKPLHLLMFLMLTSPRLCYEPNRNIINITVHTDKKNYKDAETFCKNRKMFLAMPKNKDELKEMNKTLDLNFYFNDTNGKVIWIGLKREDFTGEGVDEHFHGVYSDGSKNTSFNDWSTIGWQPDGFKRWIGRKFIENCVEMRIQNYEKDAWGYGSENNFMGWNDQVCDKERAFFCQYVTNLKEWTEWSTEKCSVTCGRGTQKETRTCEGENGVCAGDGTRIGNCVYGKCPEPEWGEWSLGKCEVTCGTGRRMKTRECKGGDTCPGKGTETGPECHGPPCSEPAWGPWSACTVTCGPGEEKKTRDCTAGDCRGADSETRVCFTACPGIPPCTDNGGCSHYCEERSGYAYCKCPKGFILAENELTCEEPKEEPQTTTEAPKEDDKKALIIAGGVAGGLVLALIVACCFLCKYFCGSKRQERTTENEGGSSWRARFSKQSSMKGQKSQTSKGTSGARGTGVDSDSSSSSGSSSGSSETDSS